MDPADEVFMGGVLAGVVANLLWFFITAFFALAYVYRKDRSKFSGRWKSVIHWKSDWAKEMLIGRESADPNSEGELALSFGFGAKRNQYWGLSVWKLRDGAKPLADLCVELRSIELERKWSRQFPFLTFAILKARLSSKIRREHEGFSYAAEFASYEISFSKTTEDSLEGAVYVTSQGGNPRREVGTFSAERFG